jgi:large subunit ribosomal protein L18
MDPKEKELKRKRRHKRTRARIKGTKEVPRLSIYRSNKHIYAQLIDDQMGETLSQASDQELEESEIEIDESKFKENFRDPEQAQKTFQAYKVGKLLAQRAAKQDIAEVKFDRSGYKYHGRVKALAEGAREAGLEC